jgi:hypothetical protein
MRHHVTLTITSLLAILLFSLHWADEVARGIEPGTMSGFGGLVILGVWLSATLVFADRRWGLALILLGSLLAAVVPVLHMQGKGLVGGRIAANSSGALFWVWTNIALGATGMVSLALSADALLTLRRRRFQPAPPEQRAEDRVEVS